MNAKNKVYAACMPLTFLVITSSILFIPQCAVASSIIKEVPTPTNHINNQFQNNTYDIPGVEIINIVNIGNNENQFGSNTGNNAEIQDSLVNKKCQDENNTKSNSQDTVETETQNSSDLPQNNVNNKLIMPVNTPGSTSQNLEQMREYYQNIKSPDTNIKQENVPLVPAVDNSNKSNDIKDIPTVFIKEITFGKSNIFSQNDLDNFSANLKNKKITADDINNLIHTINISYKEKGYLTAKAYLPPQQLDGEVLKIDFIEGRVGKIVIKNNKYTRKAYIADKFKEKPGQLFELSALENDIQNFNINNDNIKLEGKIKAGEALGTTDILLNAKEGFPVHIVPSFDNFGRDSVGLLRGGVATSVDSVLGYQDRLTTGVNLGRSSLSTFTDYNFPVFNKGTRIGGTFAYSNIAVTSGPYKDYDVKGDTYLYSIYGQHPWISTSRFYLASNIGVNFKQSNSTISDNAHTKLDEKSLLTGLSTRYFYRGGAIYSSHTISGGYTDNEVENVTKGFIKYEGNITSIHNLKYGISNIFKVMGQYTPSKLETLEQFQVGGVSTVRGFSEGLLLGNNGYLVSEEMLFPIPVLPRKIFKYKLRDNIRFSIFADHGAAYPDHGEGVCSKSKDYLTSAGIGLRVTLTRFITSRLYWGFGFDKRESDQPTSRFHFDLVSFPF